MRIPGSWTTRFVAGSVGGAVALILLFWAYFGFQALGLGFHGTLALMIGIVLSVGLAVGLMALML
jgi:hypothetical protein